MSDSLFNEFNEVSSKQWKQKIQFELKGADYNETLVWKTPEGIDVKPFYHLDDFNGFPSISNTKTTSWKIAQKIYAGVVGMANKKALDVLNRGAESICFIIPSEEIIIEDLLAGIDLSRTPIHFEFQFLSREFVQKLAEFISDKNAKIYLNIDIIGNLARSGNWFFNLKKDHEILEGILKHSTAFETSLSVDLSLYQNAGANIVQQLAYAMAHANEYLNHFHSSGFKVLFKTSVGSNYFFEIAKLKALRMLWQTLASEYNITNDCHIFATPTKRNKTLYDYNVNMLRTTTECMSAVLGGANTVCNLPYDTIYHKDNEFGERISRNQLLILKHESYLDKVDNPSDGAYYIETLTEQLAEKALDLFKQIEAGGGFLKQLKEHNIQRKIKESAEIEQLQFDTQKEVLIGTNKHKNTSDGMKNDLELYPFVKVDTRKTLIHPIIERRLAEKLEQERLKEEQ